MSGDGKGLRWAGPRDRARRTSKRKNSAQNKARRPTSRTTDRGRVWCGKKKRDEDRSALPPSAEERAARRTQLRLKRFPKWIVLSQNGYPPPFTSPASRTSKRGERSWPKALCPRGAAGPGPQICLGFGTVPLAKFFDLPGGRKMNEPLGTRDRGTDRPTELRTDGERAAEGV